MSALLQVLGALGVLTAFVAVQLGLTRPTSYLSLTFNLWGSALLAALALIDRQWGFLLLEGVWALVSAYGLLGRIRGRPVASH